MTDMLTEIVTFLVNNLFSYPAFLVGLVVLVGLLLQRKSFSDTVSGTVKTIAGFLLVSIGAGSFISGLLNFQALVGAAFHLPPVTYTGMGLAQFTVQFGGYAALVMAIGFVIHLILARVSPYRNVYLTGHLMWWMSLGVLSGIVEVFPNMPIYTMLIIAAVIMAVYWTIQPAYIHKFMKIVRGADDIAYGHTSSFGCWLSALFGRFVGKPEESSEKVKIPETISFLKDYTVGTAVVIGIIMLLASLAAGPAVVQPMAGTMNYLVWSIYQACYFAAGLTVLLVGVRMIITEIVPAFRGISMKIIPGARPALDCPIIFPTAPTAVLLGFISSTVAFLILMVVFAAIKWCVIIPPMIMLFFPGGACGVYGNAVGGWKGAILGGLINGVLLAFGQAIIFSLLATTVPEMGAILDPDYTVMILLIVGILRVIKGV